MSRCDRCGKEVGNLFCGHCREEIMAEAHERDSRELVPVLYWDRKRKGYVAGCSVLQCPCNAGNGYCSSLILTADTLKNILHEYDGDNIVFLPCG